MKVLSAEIYHETNTFSCRKTTLQDFRNRSLLFADEAIKERGDANTEFAGFLDTGRKYLWDIEHVLSATAVPSGVVTSAAFEYLCEPVITAAKTGNFDGLLLGLHGAMVTEVYEDGDGEILKRLRNVIGVDLPIAITLDLHANVTEQMCNLANIIVSYKTYPHIDMRIAGAHAGEILQRAMSGEISPRTICINRPMLEEVNGGRTDIGPMIERFEQARNYETLDDVFAVSINAGFASADIAQMGPTVLVTGQGNFAKHEMFAEAIANDIWARRYEVLNEYLSVEAAAKIANNYASPKGPLVIADYADNPGGGGYGDSTELLRALLEVEIGNACFGPMLDEEVVQQLQNTHIGTTVNISLGGKTDAHFGGGPLNLNVELLSLSDGDFIGDGPMVGGLSDSFGKSAVVRINNIDILIVSIANQMLDLQQFKAFGINPEKKTVVALKSMQHFRAAFEPIAGEVIVCDSGALCTLNYQRLPYQNIPRPMFPLDD
ncbi:MAG: microcystin degradation protein MlrC [Parasphingorhabdus sp.]|jgi:microcystin degradation protein MlrC